MLFIMTDKETGSTHIMEDSSEKLMCHLEFDCSKYLKEEWNFDTDEITCEHCKAIYNEESDEYCSFPDEVMTFAEATERWNLKDSTLRKAAERNAFKTNEVKKSKGAWLITREAMTKRYGKEPKD